MQLQLNLYAHLFRAIDFNTSHKVCLFFVCQLSRVTRQRVKYFAFKVSRDTGMITRGRNIVVTLK